MFIIITPSILPGLLPCRKMGREPERYDHMPRDVLCVVLCVVLIIELLPTQFVLRVISSTRALLGVLNVTETIDQHCKAVSLLAGSGVYSFYNAEYVIHGNIRLSKPHIM